jgi:membrane glycosyltransferase
MHIANDIPAPDRQPPVSRQVAGRGNYRLRRLLVLALNVTTVVALTLQMAAILATNGWDWPEFGILACFFVTLPWLSLGFWNAVIGFLIARFADNPAVFVNPAWADADSNAPVGARTAVALAIRNEQPDAALARLESIKNSLDATGWGHMFAFHVLSDTSRPDVATEEERLIAEWRSRDDTPDRIFYRRRSDNAGFKAGNISEFCHSFADRYDFFLPLDADSLMSGPAILRLVRCLEAHPEIGILQGLVVGRPADSFFARVFQFGMRHGMRSYTAGSAWWQGDCGPFWGHNAAIRLQPFRDHCELPVLPGTPPLGGYVLSHDQVEAVLMRRAGYECRVVAEEDDSFEENPPSLQDFIKRDLRWCQGNMQYLKLLDIPGLPVVSRIQLMLAILMYVGAPGWMLLIIFGVAQVYMPAGNEAFPAAAGLSLFITVMTMSFMPKIMGVLDTLLDAGKRRAYGGGFALLAGFVTETLFSALMAPVIGFAVARFMAGLAFGKRVAWEAQVRVGGGLSWGDAIRGLWPQTLAGALILGIFWVEMPSVLPWAAPIFVAFLACIPFAVVTASPALGRLAKAAGLCRIPEETIKPVAVSRQDAPSLPLAGQEG